MIHQLRDKKQIAKRKTIIRNLVVIGVLVVLSISGFISLSGRAFNVMGKPFWKVENSITRTAHNASYLIRTKSSVFKENDNLIQENLDLKSKMIDYQIIKDENVQLKELLGRVVPGNEFILATILTKPNRSPYDTIIVDAGSNAGVSEGFKVFGNATVPIGEVSKVYANNSLIMLYSNPGQVTEGVLDGSNTSVELVGRGGGNFEMTIPLDLPSDNGKFVILPNTRSEIIAIIDGVLSTPTDPMKKVILRSPVNIQSLKWVEIKKN